MSMVRMKATPTIPESAARRLQYRTRMLQADLMGGQEFEVSASDARLLRKAKWAEEVGGAPEPQRRPRGRPPKIRTEEPAPPPAPPVQAAPPTPDDEEPLEDMTVAALREVAEARGLELPSGYVRHDQLVKLLRGERVDDWE